MYRHVGSRRVEMFATRLRKLVILVSDLYRGDPQCTYTPDEIGHYSIDPYSDIIYRVVTYFMDNDRRRLGRGEGRCCIRTCLRVYLIIFFFIRSYRPVPNGLSKILVNNNNAVLYLKIFKRNKYRMCTRHVCAG